MNLLLPLALLLAANAHPPGRVALPQEVSEALSQALSIPGARIVPTGWEARVPAGCRVERASLSGSVTASARLPVKLYGPDCLGWGWVRFEVWAPAATLRRPVRAGQPLQPALVIQDREIKMGRAGFLPPEGATAVRDLPSGTVLGPEHVAGARLAAGERVKVIVSNGGLVVETQGRALGCGAGKTCAVLSSGRHVEGHFQDGQLLVELP
jgi:flagella basal body P-ring formation protein FlgA